MYWSMYVYMWYLYSYIPPELNHNERDPTHSRPRSITFYFITQFLWLHAATVMLALHTPFKLYSQSFR